MYMIEHMPVNKLQHKDGEKQVDYLDFEWHELNGKIHRMQSRNGRDVGIRLGDEVLKHGLRDGDILYEDEEVILAVNVLPFELLCVTVEPEHSENIARVCYEIGNTHAALFRGDTDFEFLTPYSEPLKKLLEKLHGVHVKAEVRKPDFDAAISSGAHHAHSH